MRGVSAAFNAEQKQEVTTFATCFLLTRTDGKKFGFTNHNEAIVFDGETYHAHTGFVPSAAQYSDSLSVDNLEIEALFEDERLTDAELRAGLFDYAVVEYFEVNWLDLTMGKDSFKTGTVGEITRQRRAFVAEVRGPSQPLQQVVGEVLTPTCRADLGDTRCTVDVPALTVQGTVTAEDAKARRSFVDSARTEEAGLFDYGLLTWLTGDNADVTMEVKRHTAGGSFELFLEVPYPIAVGDTYEVYPGCDKRWETCHAQFDNHLNFRGEPNLVGKDELFKFGNQ